MLRVTFYIRNDARHWENKQYLCTQIEFSADGQVTLLFSDGQMVVKPTAFDEMTVYESVFEEFDTLILFDGNDMPIKAESTDDASWLEDLVAGDND